MYRGLFDDNDDMDDDDDTSGGAQMDCQSFLYDLLPAHASWSILSNDWTMLADTCATHTA